jgi:hypothetical protein
MGSQAAQSAAASGFADLCQQAATNQVTGFPNIDQQPVFNGDCNDPVNASNPICVNCRGPNAQSDPLCSGLSGGSASTGSGSGSGSSFQNTGFGTRAADGSDLSVPDTNAQSQAPIFGEGLGEEARANAIPNNGGGFAGSVVLRVGPQAGLLTRAEIEAQLQKRPKYVSVLISDPKTKAKIMDLVKNKKV